MSTGRSWLPTSALAPTRETARLSNSLPPPFKKGELKVLAVEDAALLPDQTGLRPLLGYPKGATWAEPGDSRILRLQGDDYLMSVGQLREWGGS